MQDLDPIPAGTHVIYRGTLVEHWGDEFIARPCGRDCRPCHNTRLLIHIGELPATADPGDRYELLDIDADPTGTTGIYLTHVRRRSITTPQPEPTPSA